MIISFPSPVEYHEWCEKFCSLLATKSPQTQHLHAPPPYTPQQVSKVTFYLLEEEYSSFEFQFVLVGVISSSNE